VSRTTCVLSTIVAAAFLAACGATPQPASPAPQAAPQAAGAPAPAAPAAPAAAAAAAPSIVGDWDVRISTAQRGVIATVMRIVARGDNYVGVMQPLLTSDGNPAIPGASGTPIQVRGATVVGNRVTISLDLEGDEGRIAASFRSPTLLDGAFSSRALTGRVTLQKR